MNWINWKENWTSKRATNMVFRYWRRNWCECVFRWWKNYYLLEKWLASMYFSERCRRCWLDFFVFHRLPTEFHQFSCAVHTFTLYLSLSLFCSPFHAISVVRSFYYISFFLPCAAVRCVSIRLCMFTLSRCACVGAHSTIVLQSIRKFNAPVQNSFSLVSRSLACIRQLAYEISFSPCTYISLSLLISFIRSLSLFYTLFAQSPILLFALIHFIFSLPLNLFRSFAVQNVLCTTRSNIHTGT